MADRPSPKEHTTRWSSGTLLLDKWQALAFKKYLTLFWILTHMNISFYLSSTYWVLPKVFFKNFKKVLLATIWCDISYNLFCLGHILTKINSFIIKTIFKGGVVRVWRSFFIVCLHIFFFNRKFSRGMYLQKKQNLKKGIMIIEFFSCWFVLVW